ncbi:hypothetical protein [Clostridium senegalense]
MLASECRLGKKLKHKQSKDIMEVQEINGIKLWVNLNWGDRFSWVDEDLYDDLDYFTE